MDDLLNSLVVRQNGKIVSASQALDEQRSSQKDMAAAVSSPLSSQELNLPFRDNTFNDIEMNPFTPPPSAQGGNDENVPPKSGFGGMANLQNIADFDRENPYDPLAKRKLVPLDGSKWNSDNIVKFHNLCQSHGFAPDYTYSQSDTTPYRFNAKVVFGLNTEQTSEWYSSKRQARDAVCKLAVERFPPIDQKAGTKRKSSGLACASSSVDKSENWVGILVENYHQKKAFAPKYQDFCTESYPIQFGCTITLEGGPLTPFGSNLVPFSSEQDAKVAAAKEAVLWLRSFGVVPQMPMKRQKKKSPSPEAAQSGTGNTGLTQVVNAFKMDADSPASFRHLVHNLVAQLGFQQPRFDSQPVSSTSTGESLSGANVLFNVAAYFKEDDVAVEPRLKGAIGQVERIYGRKKAQEACCQKLQPLLEDIKRRRLGLKPAEDLHL